MQIMTAENWERQQRYLEGVNRRANSRSARWRHNTRKLLVYPFHFTAMVWGEFKDRHRTRLAKKLSEQPPPKPLVLRDGTRSSQTRSKLLSLPAEIRLMIWEHVMGGKLITLHRKDGKIMHRSIDVGDTKNITNATAQIVRQTRHDSTATPSTPRVGLLAILQTCQTIYLENIKILYQANTFVCLDHKVLNDLCKGPTSSHISLVRSLHIHFHSNQYPYREEEPDRQMFWSPWDLPESIGNDFHQALPNLRTLSIFLQNSHSLFEEQTYEDMLGRLRDAYQHPISVQIMALQLPYAHFGGYQMRPLDVHPPDARMLVDSKCRDYFIIQQSRISLKYPPSAKDRVVENDMWRVGILLLEPDDRTEADLTLEFAIFIEECDEPPLLWDIVRTS